MAGDPLWINVNAGAPSYTANELRQAMALGVMFGGRLLGGRQGVRPGGDQLKTSLVSSTITVKAGVACVDPALSTPQGPYWVALPADETFTLTAADATNPRKDITILRVYDHDEDTSGLRLARSEYLVGTPNPAPVEPAVPAGAFRLATIDVPASPGTPVVTDRRPWTVAPGGILPVAADADLAAAVEGRYRDRLDLNLLERDTGAAWETIADPDIFKAWTSFTCTWSSTGTAPAIGNGTLIATKKKIGKILLIQIRLQWGSTTTGGTGNWSFSIDETPALDSQPLTALVSDNSPAAIYPAVGHVVGASVATVSAHTSTGTLGFVTATHPITWATSDRLSINGVLRVS